MKKLLLIVASTLAMLLIPAAAAAAAPNPDYTVVTGTVTNNGKDVNNAGVTVICNNHVQKTRTDSNGVYNVSYTAAQCPPGTNVTVTASKGSKGGENNGKVKQYSTDLNIALVNVALPELGLITGVSAAILGGGTFMFIRRRQLSTQEA